MIIKRMKADFGKLQGATLELKSGLNIIEASNESGKSTWCAFLRIMLYGLDTSRRETAKQKPDKVLYAPWSGVPMAGSMDVEHKDREYTIQRFTRRATAPMADLNVLLAGTADRVRTMENTDLGETLTGVPRSVFSRTAFISGGALSVESGGDLEKRIASMVSSGEENVSYSEANFRLLKLQKSLRTHDGGRLTQIENEAKQLKAGMAEVSSAYNEQLRQRATADELRQEIRSLQNETGEDLDIERSEIKADLALCRRDKEALDQEEENISKELAKEGGNFLPRLLPGIMCFLLAALVFIVGSKLTEYALVIALALVFAGIAFCIWSYSALKLVRRKKALEKRLEEISEKRQWILEHVQELKEEYDSLTERTKEYKQQIEDLEAEERLALDDVAATKGRLEKMQDPEYCQTRLSTLKEEYQRLSLRYEALQLAMDELREADKEMQDQFSPAVAKEAGRIFAALTGGDYDSVAFDRDLQAMTRRSGDTVSHPDAYLSRGTLDQLYLALRLALVNLLLPEDEGCPIVLDDALINFDDKRLGYALDVLKEMAKKRQILLFTCHSRENAYLRS